MSEDQQQGSTLPVVPTEFDEGVLRALCDSDASSQITSLLSTPIEWSVLILSKVITIQCGMPLLLDRLKQSSASCRVRLSLFPSQFYLSMK